MKPFTHKDREKLLEEVYKKLQHLLLNKGREYAGGNVDTLHNFTARAQWVGLERKAIMFLDKSKHTDAIKNWAIGNHKLTLEQAENRLIDEMVYNFLLIAEYRNENGGR